MPFVLEFLGLLALFGILLKDYKIINELERERYENTFISQQKSKNHGSSAVPIPLAFKTSDTKFFVHLCKRYRYVRKSRRRHEDSPSVQTLLIGTKKAGYSNFQAEAIQCSQEYAIVDAGDDTCAYILRRGKTHKNEVPVYYLHAKFCYCRQKKTKKKSPKIAEDDSIETTVIQTESRDGQGPQGLKGLRGGLNKIMPWKIRSRSN